MLVVGLTGGIASGKSAASDYLATLGVPIVDTDLIAREVVEPGQPAMQEIVRQFGGQFILSDGSLDRRKMRTKIFSDPQRRRALEAILHPPIRAETARRIRSLNAPYCVVVIPLLVEAGQRDLVDRVLVVDVNPELQRQRLRERDHMSEREIDDALAAQSSREARLALADDVVVNEGTLPELHRALDQLHTQYLAASP